MQTGVVEPDKSELRTRAIFAAVAGARLMARRRGDLSRYDATIDTCRMAALLPA